MKRYTVRVTYWINVEANNPKDAEEWAKNNPTEYQIEYIDLKVLKKAKPLKYPKGMYE